MPRQLVAHHQAGLWWPAVAPILEHVWNEHADVAVSSAHLSERAHAALTRLRAYLVSRRQPTVAWGEPLARQLSKATELVRAARVISVSQAAEAAIDYLARDEGLGLRGCLIALGRAPRGITLLELDRLKEGHTASVFRVTCTYTDGQRCQFAVLVARDAVGAADELRANARDLEQWSRRQPKRVARVVGVGEGRCAWFGERLILPVVATEWLEGHREVHVVPDADARGRIVLVTNFVARQGEALPEIDGIIFDRDASDIVWSEIIELRTCLAEIDWADDRVTAPALELNEGDVTCRLRDGEFHTAIIGANDVPWQGTTGAWCYEVALSHARSYAGPLYWGAARLAIEAVVRGLDAEQRHVLVSRGLEQAPIEQAHASHDDEHADKIIAATRAALTELSTANS